MCKVRPKCQQKQVLSMPQAWAQLPNLSQIPDNGCGKQCKTIHYHLDARGNDGNGKLHVQPAEGKEMGLNTHEQQPDEGKETGLNAHEQQTKLQPKGKNETKFEEEPKSQIVKPSTPLCSNAFNPQYSKFKDDKSEDSLDKALTTIEVKNVDTIIVDKPSMGFHWDP